MPFLRCLVLLAFFAGPAAAGDFGLEKLRAADIPSAAGIDAPKSFFSPAPQPPKVREWTLMLYMNGKSDLGEVFLHRMKALEHIGANDSVAVVVELARTNSEHKAPADGENWTGSRRYLIRPGNAPGGLQSPVLAEFPDADMGDWRRAAEFIKWAKANYPAKRYLFAIGSHGYGWYDPAPAAGKALSMDPDTKHFIGTAEMKNIFEEAGGVDLYLNDACLMQGIEVAYQIKDFAKVVVGAEDIAYGYDYVGVLYKFYKNPVPGPEELARLFIEDYFTAYKSEPKMQLSAIRTAELDPLAALVKEWARLAKSGGDKAALKAAKEGVKRFDTPFYADLAHFVELYAAAQDPARPGAAELAGLSARIAAHVRNDLVAYKQYRGDLQDANGVSINIPGGEYQAWMYKGQYAKLDFAKAVPWQEFIDFLDTLK